MTDIRLKLYVHKMTAKGVIVQRKSDWAAAPVEIPERDIDYIYELVPGHENYFFIPIELAKRVGLVAEKGDFIYGARRI